ncbi:MAG TPA: flagellar biosynthetic protein FliR [Myxococcota bacterium]|nr:flagellar biosynthetic protein FliR [Myxococcota bacterium]
MFFLLIFTRMLAMSTMMPIFGAQVLPGLTRVVLSAILSSVVFAPLINQAEALAELSVFFLTMLFLKEAIFGIALGFLASLLFFAYELFGELIDISRGASMSKLLVPELKHQSSPMGTLFFQLALVITIALGFHRTIIAASYKSFLTFPVISLAWQYSSPTFTEHVFAILQTLFECALRLALPVILICLVIDLAFGLMNRVAPQINAYFLSLPAKMVGGLLILIILLPFLLDDFHDHYHSLTSFFDAFINGAGS